MILKLRVPDYIEKRLVQQFTHSNETLYSDLTVHRRQFGYGEIPVYTIDESNEAQFYAYFDGEELSELGIN